MIYTDKRRKIPLALVVDDDASLRMVMVAALRKFGLYAIEADSGSSSIEVFKSEKPDIVLMDVVMPDMDGFDACKIIRQSPGGTYTQILMVTGLEDTESTKKAFDVGANGFVTKPLSLVMLGYRVQYMLRAGHAFRELDINRSRLAKTQELARIGNWQVDLGNNEFYCSPEACSLLGLSSIDNYIVLDAFIHSIIDQDKSRVKKTFGRALQTKKGITLEYQVCDIEGSQRYILNKSEIVFDEQAKPLLMLGIVQDISPLKRAEEEIRFLAFYDGLTGLANRMLFMDRLDQAIVCAKRNKKHFALLFLDLDNFKQVNDTLGHHIGDRLLKKVADSITKSIRKSDSATRLGQEREPDSLIARLGGDEFTILVTDLKDSEYAALIAQRLLKVIPVAYGLDGNDVSITTSIGISVFPEDGNKADTLLKNADTAMYHAKKEGKNTYQFFMDSMNKAALERFSMDRDIKKALQNNEFVLYYQPQLNLSDRKIVGAEALIRWHHPLRGMIPPDKFIPIAEESGIIIEINRWVFLTACQQAEQWMKQGLCPVRMAINLSGYKLASQKIIETIETVLQQTKFDAHNIEIEITENVLMQDTKATVSTLNKIKDLKLKIALDDFGTGYSSLSYLTSFPVDTIKIDRSFVMDCTSKSNNLVIIKAIIAMGHSLGKKIIAEGIETEEQYHLLKDSGCDECQGYYFSRPVPPDEFVTLLNQGRL
ncbi:MAG: EAL domain-containing protein [Desulfobacula sp.]|nr:EAL domain-containing protein [Desulfobacula sp.]